MSALLRLPQRQLSNLSRAIRKIVRRSILSGDRSLWIEVRVAAGPPEVGSGVALGGGGDSPLGMLELLRILDAAAEDSALSGVLLQFEDGFAGWGRALALRRSVRCLRERGKRVVAWGAGYSAQQYLVASACDLVWLPPTGSLGLVGVRASQFYVRDLLEKWEIEPEVVRVGRFKNAAEPLTRTSMSDEQREQIESWQQDVFAELVEGIAKGRGLDPQAVRERIDAGPYTAEGAVQAGLVDECLYPDQIDARLALGAEEVVSPRVGAGPEADAATEIKRVRAPTYYALEGGPGWQPLLRDSPSIAYVHAAGGIHPGSGSRGIATDRLGRLLDQLRERSDVCAVVLRLDSPGGNALASDLLHRSAERLADEKPLVVSMGEVVASGGYYLAAPAHAILAEPATLTGSIGVVGGKLNLEGLYRRLGVAKDAVEIGARAGLYAEDRSFTEEERSVVERSMEAIYQVFLARVAAGRGLSMEAVGEVAEGRVWSGRRALELGLVDGLGGPLEALWEARRRSGLADHEPFNLDVLPRRSPLRGFGELLRSLLEVG